MNAIHRRNALRSEIEEDKKHAHVPLANLAGAGPHHQLPSLDRQNVGDRAPPLAPPGNPSRLGTESVAAFQNIRKGADDAIVEPGINPFFRLEMTEKIGTTPLEMRSVECGGRVGSEDHAARVMQTSPRQTPQNCNKLETRLEALLSGDSG